MPSGKHRSKENTWTEKDLNEALQGEKPRRSKDESKRREKNEDSSQKHGKERTSDVQEGRRRSKQERSSKIRDEYGVNDGAGSSSGTRSERKDRDRNGTRDKHSNGDNEKRRRGEHSNNHGENERERRKRGEENGDNGSDDEDRKRRDERRRQKREREDTIREGGKDYAERRQDRRRESDQGKSREDDRRRNKDYDERKRESKDRGDGGRRDREGDDRRRDYDDRKEGREHIAKQRDKEDRTRDKERGDRRKDYERDDRRRDLDDRKDGKEHRVRQRDEESYDKRRNKVYDDRKESNEHKDRKRDDGSDDRRKERDDRKRDRKHESERDDRRREKERSDRRNDKEGRDDDDEHDDRERRRRKREEKSRKESEDVDSGQHSRDREKERRRKKRDEEADDMRDEDDDDEQRRERRKKRREKEEKQSKEKEHPRSHKEITKSLSTQSAGEVVEDIANDYNEDNYEDDFEDYEDDFEDGGDVDEDDDQISGDGHDKGKLFEIFEAINAENSDVARLSPYSNTPTEDSSKEESEPVGKPVRSSGEGRINFFAAKQKHVTEFVASKTKKRAEELKNLIELDVASYDIFDLPPLNEYEIYIKSYGQSDSKQAYVQCHDDIVEKEMQTEEIEVNSKWTQYPPDGFKGYGGDEDNDKELVDATFSPHSVDSIKLSNFLQKAGQVCLILLEEMVCGKADLMFKERNDINISDGFIQLETRLSFLEGRRILDVCFNPIQTHILLTAHDLNQAASDNCLHGKGVVCFWNVNEPTQPQKIMFCESSPGSCCFSPIKSSLVFAGLDDGSIVIWDIREASSLHSTKKDKDNQWIVRRPTFSTAGVFSEENHTSPIRTILPISLPKESAQASMRTSLAQDDLATMAFQLASLEENGCVNIWVVIELDDFDEAGSESDLGMAPGGRIKLVKTTRIQVESPHRNIFIGSALQSSMMQFSTEDSNHFYVATDRSWVVHCTRYGGKTQPKTYKPIIDSFVTISAMDISPWSIPIILVGCADGSIRLHDLNKELPIRCWTETTKNNSIIQMMWSRSKPSMFYVLDNQSTLYIWDLLENDSAPISNESFKRGRLLSFSLSNDYECLGIGLPGRKSELVLNYEGGIIELHRLKEIVTSFQADELDKFASLIDSFIS